jgi:hypothetical protein
MKASLVRPRRWFRTVLKLLGWVALVTLLVGAQHFWRLRALPDNLGTILYNAYLDPDRGVAAALEELNGLSTYEEDRGDQKPHAVVTGFRFSVQEQRLIVSNARLNDWVASAIVDRVAEGGQLRADAGPEATASYRRKNWRDTARELRALGLSGLVLRNESGQQWEIALP